MRVFKDNLYSSSDINKIYTLLPEEILLITGLVVHVVLEGCRGERIKCFRIWSTVAVACEIMHVFLRQFLQL